MSELRVLRSPGSGPCAAGGGNEVLRPRMEAAEFGGQVAGHRATEEGRYTGLLQCPDGTILKPILKESQRREIEFYEHLERTEDPDLIELKQFIPKYFGTKRHMHNGFEQEYIVLEDLTKGVMQPCVMDIKIGKRTWDPLASEHKVRSEQSKYSACKQQYSFCIPGYQVFQLASSQQCRYGKQHGKKLHGELVIAAFRNFLNGSGSTVCRSLVLQLLCSLWSVQRWATRARRLRVYSCSLLLVYSAQGLQHCCGGTGVNRAPQKCRPNVISRSRTFHSLQSLQHNSFTGQLSAKGPIFKKFNSVQTHHFDQSQPASPTLKSPWSDALDTLGNNHSFDHNYDQTLNKIKMDYQSMLDQLSSDKPPVKNPMGTVKIIDFAHAFFNDDSEVGIDENFKEGIDSLVDIFEMLLKETDDQVF